MRLRLFVCAVLLASTAQHVRASDLSDFNAMVADAYAYYRSAVFYLRTGNAMVAGFELDQMRERWSTVMSRFADAPPDAFSDDPQFSSVLADTAARVDRAATAAAKGDTEVASEALQPIRNGLAEMRARAGVRVFSDCVDEINAAMDALFVYRRTPPALDDTGSVNDAKSKAAVLGYLARRCDGEAATAAREDGEFRRLIDGLTASVKTLFQALDRRDETAVINILREMRSFDRILFLRFG